jgi:3-phenylpropionate/trans-cinnamate dioxygenase ferredoxin reductase subunit
VHVLRSFADADRIRPLLGGGTRWLVVGGGFIGAEFAASARLTGSEVDLVMPEQLILQAPFGDVAAGWFDARLRRQGVHVHEATTVASLALDGDVVRVGLADGSTLEVDHVCVGIGVAPVTGLAQQAGLDLDMRGIATDRSLQTSAPGVYAVGDVCAYDSVLHGHRVRIEHWDIARAHGVHVAKQVASGEPREFDALPYFFGTMGTWAFLEYVGVGTGTAVVRGSLDDDDLAIAYLDGDTIVGMLTVGRPDDITQARTLITERAEVNPAAVADPSVPLAECRRGAGTGA